METNTTTSNLSANVTELVGLVTSGQILPAFHRFYSADVVMQENTKEPTVGFATNLAREEGFVAYVQEVHENRAASVTVDETNNTVAIHWILDFTAKDGNRLRFDQVALQKWAEGKIVHEQFFYNAGS